MQWPDEKVIGEWIGIIKRSQLGEAQRWQGCGVEGLHLQLFLLFCFFTFAP